MPDPRMVPVLFEGSYLALFHGLLDHHGTFQRSFHLVIHGIFSCIVYTSQ